MTHIHPKIIPKAAFFLHFSADQGEKIRIETFRKRHLCETLRTPNGCFWITSAVQKSAEWLIVKANASPLFEAARFSPPSSTKPVAISPLIDCMCRSPTVTICRMQWLFNDFFSVCCVASEDRCQFSNHPFCMHKLLNFCIFEPV